METRDTGRESPWMTLTEAAGYLKVHRATLWRASKDGRLRRSGSGGVTRFHIADLDAFMGGNEHTTSR